VTDPDAGDQLRLELQVEKVNTGFSATAAVSAPVASGQTATVTFGAPFEDNTGYHWRVRTCDQTNRCSGWVSFGGGNPETTADFFANPTPEPPVVPTNLGQFQTNGTPIPTGGHTGGVLTTTVVLKGQVTDPDPGDTITLEVEVTGLTTSSATGSSVASGNASTASVTVVVGTVLTPISYTWRARACDQTNQCSAWVPRGGNPDFLAP